LMGDEDWDWHVRIARQHRIGFVAEASVLFRQRALGSFDALQLKRLPYTRRVFFRHAIPARHRWRTSVDLLRSYVGALRVYHNYFANTAISSARSGHRIAALRAIWIALWILPPQTFKSLIKETPLRSAFLATIMPRYRIAAPPRSDK
jgi:hypothetical protein